MYMKYFRQKGKVMIWKCTDKNIEYGDRPLVMGIVNVTPDSFSDGGDHFSPESAIECALKLVEDGADILDFGAQSTRPGYTEITPLEELDRLEPIISKVRAQTDVPISIDTYFPVVALNTLEWGANIINDVSGVVTKEMANVVKNNQAGWIIMHNGAGGVDEVNKFFVESAQQCDALGIDRAQICFDMGIGFGKDRLQDLALISRVSDYKVDGYPLLLGTSRKRVIGEYGGESVAKNRDYGNIAADTAAILGGVDIIRLHNVKAEKQGIDMAYAIKKMQSKG